MRHNIIIFLISLLIFIACKSNKATIEGTIKEFNENSLILLRQAEQIDTININSDGTFKYSLPIEKDGEYRLVILSDNQPNGNIPCYIAAGEKTCIEIAWEEKESSFMGNRRKYFSFVPYFSGGTQRECEFLNIPSYLDYKFNNPDGTPVPFKDYVRQIEQQQDFLREKLKGARKSFVEEKSAQIDELTDILPFLYHSFLRSSGNDATQDADFMQYVGSINLNDEKNLLNMGFSPLAGNLIFYMSTFTGEIINFKLEQNPEFYKNESHIARYLNFLRDSISNKKVKSTIADIQIRNLMASGGDSQLQDMYNLYLNIADTTTEQFQKNKDVYENLQKLLPGVKATNFTMQDPEGNTVQFLDVIGKGKITYIDFWATWCGPCCAEIPYVEKLVEHYKNNNNIEILSISLDNSRTKWLEKIAEDKPAWKQFLIPEAFNSEFAKEYNITAIPRFMIFDDNAKIVSINAPRPSSSEIIKYLDSLSNTK